jgi:hypothetical protein
MLAADKIILLLFSSPKSKARSAAPSGSRAMHYGIDLLASAATFMLMILICLFTTNLCNFVACARYGAMMTYVSYFYTSVNVSWFHVICNLMLS